MCGEKWTHRQAKGPLKIPQFSVLNMRATARCFAHKLWITSTIIRLVMCVLYYSKILKTKDTAHVTSGSTRRDAVTHLQCRYCRRMTSCHSYSACRRQRHLPASHSVRHFDRCPTSRQSSPSACHLNHTSPGI